MRALFVAMLAFMLTYLTTTDAVCGVQNSLAMPKITNQCISFSVGAGTGCAWMCAHCADALGPSYYFTDGVCQYQSGGCVGNPQSGVTYTCCAGGMSK